MKKNNTSKTDVAPWCYKWDWMDGWKSPGGGMYRAPYGANKGIGDAGSTADIGILWSAIVCLGLL